MPLHRTLAPPSKPPGLVLVGVGERRVAVPVAQIVEVARVSAYTPLPGEDRTNLGVVLHRDAVVPLVDLGARFGVRRPGPVELPALSLFVRTAQGTVALLVDRILGLQPATDVGPEDAITLLDPDTLGDCHGESAPH